MEKAMQVFPVSPDEKVCMDIGASTGGFTDCMLQKGAKFVYALDCGYNQLSWKLKNDKRIKNIEKINVKNCDPEDVFDKGDVLPSFMSMDLSFISIKKVLENCKKFISDNAECVLLIKPQFEAKRSDIAHGGVVKDEKIRLEIIEDIKKFCNDIGFDTQGITTSQIQGAKSKNIEYLIYLKRRN